jgi:hypothetical protein
MPDSSLTHWSSPRRARFWRPAVLTMALVGTSVVAASCATTRTSSDSAGPSKHTVQTTGTAHTPATGTHSVDAVCADVESTKATRDRTGVIPADDAQKILADSQSSGNAKLESEASKLASASHVLDQTGTAAALAAMVATCHQLTTSP